VGSAALAGVLAIVSTPRFAGARVPPVESLPWPASVRAEARAPLALIYVQSGCGHCSRAAQLFDSVFAISSTRAIIATNDGAEAADAYRSKLGLRLAITRDSGAALIRALGTGAVPTLVLFHADGSRQLVVGFTDEAPYRSLLASFSR
jgi:hypothetical protein